MVFTADTVATLRHTAALVNTAPGDGGGEGEGGEGGGVEQLPDLASLLAWMESWQWTGRRPGTEAEVVAVRALRPRLRHLWTAPLSEQVADVNALLREHGALPRLVEHGGGLGWHIHATDDDAPLADRVAVEAAMALVDVIRATEQERLRVCAGEGCGDILVDLSRNRSRRYCEGTCGNRAHVAAYRARRRGH